MDRSRRRAIRNGRDLEYEVVDEELTRRTVSSFYDGFSSVMERVDSVYLPRTFFFELCEFDEHVKLFSLSINGTRHGSLFFVLDPKRSAVHYAYSGVTEDDFEFNVPELLHEHAIRWPIEHGYEIYDFRGARSDFRDGLFRFKERFGARIVPLLTWERGYPLASLNRGRSIYRRLSS